MENNVTVLSKVLFELREAVSDQEEAQFESLVKKLKELSYTDSIDYLDDIVKDRKLRAVLALGFGGELSDTKLNSHVVDIPVQRLMPTQNEIDLDKSLAWILNGKQDLDKFFKDSVTVVAPIITYNKTFVIDGHHRWSQAFCCNPNIKIKAINFDGDMSPLSMLKVVQSTIGSNIGRIPKSTVDGQSMYNVSKSQLNLYIQKNLTEKAESMYIDLVDSVDSREGVVKYLTDNGMNLKANNKPILGAPKRNVMPQTDEDPSVIKDLQKGVTEL